MSLLLTEADLNKSVFLMPPYPVMNYNWREVIALPKAAILFLLITSAALIAAIGWGAYIAFLGFIFDPGHHLRYGSFGLIPGILLLALDIKMLLNWLKLLSFLAGLSRIPK